MISVILAAGKGTRMKSEQSKVLHKVNGVPMIRRVVTVLENIGNKKNVFILGHKKEDVLAEMGDVDFVTQEEQLGTGHAILIAKDKIKEYGEDVLITCGDTPLLKEETLRKENLTVLCFPARLRIRLDMDGLLRKMEKFQILSKKRKQMKMRKK